MSKYYSLNRLRLSIFTGGRSWKVLVKFGFGILLNFFLINISLAQGDDFYDLENRQPSLHRSLHLDKIQGKNRRPAKSPAYYKGALSHAPSTRETTLPPNIDGIGQELRQFPELQVQGGENLTYSPGVFIRGAKSEHAILIWNGILLNDNTSPGGGGDLNLWQREFSHQMRIRKGPHSLLYGSSALGGVIEIERDPSLNSRFSTSVGDYKSHRESIEYQQESEGTHTFIGGQYFETEGVNALNNTEGDEKDSIQRQSLSLITDYEMGSDRKATGLISYFEQNNSDDVPPNDDVNATQRLMSLDCGLFTELSAGSNGEGFHEIAFTYSSRDRDNGNPPEPSGSLSWYKDTAMVEQMNMRWIYSLRQGNGFWRLGSDFQRQTLNSLSVGDSYPEVSWKEGQNQLGLIGIYEYQLGSWLLSGGGRHQIIQGPVASQVDVYQAMIQWQAELISPYLLVFSGFKAPTLPQLFLREGEKNLRSEKSQGGEAGLQGQLGKIYLQAGLFGTEFSDLIDFDLIKYKYANISGATINGIELTGQYRSEYVTWTLGFAEIYAKDSQQGLYLLRRPVHRSSFSHEARLGFGTIHTNFVWVGEREDQIQGVRKVLPGYGLLNLGGVRNYGKLEVFWKIQNILNSYYEEIAGYRTWGRNFSIGMQIFL